MDMHIYIYVYTCVYIYIYRERDVIIVNIIDMIVLRLALVSFYSFYIMR